MLPPSGRSLYRGFSSVSQVIMAMAMMLVATTLAANQARAQSGEESPEARQARSKLASIKWLSGPATGRLGSVAELRVPESCRFAEAEGSKTFLEVTHNIPSGRELGVLLCDDPQDTEEYWFVIYTYDASGYVRDDEKGSLDADAILASLRRGTEAANAERRSRGWDEMHIEGWVRPPYYDEATHNLTWSFSGRSSDGETSVNHSVRLLGRGGVLHVDLVMAPEQSGRVVPEFDGVVATTSFLPGNRYAEWRKGDKVAEYGLTALIAGGAGAVAMKTGLLAKLGKILIGLFAALWKLVAAAAVGFMAMLKSAFSRKPKSPPQTDPTSDSSS